MKWFAKWWKKPEWDQNWFESLLHIWITIIATILVLLIGGLPLWAFLYVGAWLIWK